MDSNKTTTTVGVALIFLIFVGWFYMMNQQQAKYAKLHPTPAHDSAASAAPSSAPSATPAAGSAASAAPSGSVASDSVARGGLFRSAVGMPVVTKTVETPLFTATISSTGGSITSFVLHHYKTWEQKQLDLIDGADRRGGDINLRFVANDGKQVSTSELPFVLDPKPITLGAGDSVAFAAVYHLDSTRAITKLFRFSGAGYLIGVEYQLTGMQEVVSGYHYTASLDAPLPFLERRSQDESTNAKAFAGFAGDMEELTVTKAGEATHKPINGEITFAGMRTQYFEKAMIPNGLKAIGAELSGLAIPARDGGVQSKYAAGVNIPIGHTANEKLPFNLYFGPLEYERVSALGVGLEQSMNFGWSFLVRPISIHLMMPLFMWLHGFIPNWGVVIIVFSILIKLLTIPLSTGQMRSMRKMQVLQPKVTEVRDKYKDDPKKMNEELLKVYRTYGVNPAGGCLPMLLQMPILFALYSVLRNVIELRQAPFGLWIHDLSVPDALIKFGGKLPIVGWETLSGLTLLLVATMFIQQYFTVTDPRQRSMAYIMPIIFIFMFNNLPSGVGLYYFMFNIFGLAQQFYLTKIATPPTLEEMRTDPNKSKGNGFLARLQAMEQEQRSMRQQQYTGKGTPQGKNRKK